MSEAVTVLSGAAFDGTIRVEDAGLQGMITLRGDLDEIRKSGIKVPAKGAANGVLGEGCLWMSPDELLVLCPYDDAIKQTAAISKKMKKAHHLAANVSDARSVFRLTGDSGAIREALAKLMPADLRTTSLLVGQVRRTRMAQVPAAFWLSSDTEATVICFRSVADYAFGLLTGAAKPGSDVSYF